MLNYIQLSFLPQFLAHLNQLIIFIIELSMRRSGNQARYSAAQSAHIKGVQFCTFSKLLLENWSEIEITERQLYEGMKPVRGGPNDLRLGVSSDNQRCETCGQTTQCHGHFGYIKLTQPVFHYGFMKFIQKILKCICHNCFRIRYNKNNTQKLKRIAKISNPGKRLNQFAKALQNVSICPSDVVDSTDEKKKQQIKGCGLAIPTRVFIKNYKLYVAEDEKRGEGEEKQKLKKKEIQYTAQRVKNILEGIKESDAKLLGFVNSKPIDLMIQTLAVAPPQIRPSIQMNPQKRAEDDITSAYVKIISINNELNKIDATQKPSKIDEMEKIIASIMIKLDRKRIQKGDLTARQMKALKNFKSISQRLKGKQGRFRQNLMGKRVDFSARSVVSPDACIALDQLGVPQKIANSLTIPQQVTQLNYDRLKKLCEQGKVLYMLKPSEDKRKYEDIIRLIKSNDKSAQIQKYLNYGMIVQRCLQNGDYVLFNRQPTLHRMSMMGHRVKILPYNTFRLNLSVCTPYNADFDGDQMNMHVPQSYQTISQIKHIAHVPKQIIAPKNNAPVMGIVQDALLGVYLFTMRDTFLTKEEIMNLVIWIQSKQGRSHTDDLLPGQLPIPAILKPQPLWTGKQVMSLVIPHKISVQIFKDKKEGLRNSKDTNMLIKKGQLITGALQKEVVGSGAGGLIHSIWLQIGPDATNQFMTTTQRIVNNWLMTNSFTVGACDVVPDEVLQKTIQKQVLSINKLYYNIYNKYRNSNIVQSQNLHQRGKKILDSFQFNINGQLNNKLGVVQKIVSSSISPYENNIFKMITAKSKGSETNLAQIIFLLGNQNVDGKRCPLGFSRRALPHFSKEDNSPESRGFVFSSFYNGLKPHEFFFHSMGGRQGLSDTAVKTSRTGYIQRRLIKSLQDIIVKYDGTVRDSHNNLLQKLYGQDSFTPQFIEKHKIPEAELGQKQFKNKFSWDNEEANLVKKYNYTTDNINKLKCEFRALVEGKTRLREIITKGKDTMDIQYHCPVKIIRIIDKIKSITKQKHKQQVTPLFIYQNVEKLLDFCVPPQYIAQYKELLEKYKDAQPDSKFMRQFNKQKKSFQQENGLQLFRIHLRFNLASKTLINSYKLSKNQFIGLVEEIKSKYIQASSVPGQAIGAIAAQSIGEPTTQMTLNTFHLAGVSDKNVTLGVPRLQQLLDASKNIKTPNMTIFLKNKIKQKDKDQKSDKIVSLVSFEFPERHVEDYLEASRIYYDPFYEHSNIGAGYKELSNDRRRTPWVIALSFDLKKLMMKQPWNQIKDQIQKNFEKDFQITQRTTFMEAEQSNSHPELILRCLQASMDNSNLKKFTNKERGEFLYFKFLNAKETEIKEMRISGIHGIKSIKTSKKVLFDFKPDEAIKKQSKQDHQYVVFQSDGSNLRACLAHDKVDPYKSYTNDMLQIYSILGIQAARQSFINEFKEIVKPYGIYINYRHLSVLADWMTMRGVITPVNRNGINRVNDVSVLRKASYQQTAQIMFNAAVFSEYDQLKGVSEKIIFGENINLGTGNFNILIDRSTVKDFKIKGAVDKKQDIQPSGFLQYTNDPRTPTYSFTPNPSYSTYQHSPNALANMNSPQFTPAHHAVASFTPSYAYQYQSRRSPMPLQTPISINPISSTPGLSVSPQYNPYRGISSPIYNPQGMGSHNSPHPQSFYRNSISPNYSSMRSPDYNSASPGGYSNSPMYQNRTPNRQFKAEEDHEDDNQEDNEDND